MHVIDIPLDKLRPAPWNPNAMDGAMRHRLARSVSTYGLVIPLVVRPLGDGTFQVIAGNQRLPLLQDQGAATAPCVVVDLDDTHARLLAQALNRLHGEDDLGLKAEMVRTVLQEIPAEVVVELLPETVESLTALASLGQEDLAGHLKAWEQVRSSRLRHFQAQLTQPQLDLVHQALNDFLPLGPSRDGDNPNGRGVALYRLCQAYLALKGGVP